MNDLTLLTVCGALRARSTNGLLLAEAARVFGAARVVEGDLRLPLYDNDLEDASGIPDGVQVLADQIRGADAVVISTPEYNKSLSGVLKNALDWVSRVPGAVWRDKPVAIVSAADGRAGGERAQFALRLCMVAFRPRLLAGPEVMVAHSRAAFDVAGRLIEPRSVKDLTDLMQALRVEAMR
jgi:chromate reductase, NAD(P)H dehydrogenase (quinone)